jgi:2-polyprenyl-3-methyl-5-hydroxy-6-metoxy-1,4-benzoquinol methylase
MLKENRHIDSVRTHFDVNAESWKNLYHNLNKANDIVLFNRKNISVAFLCKYLKPGSKVLDAGCGAGIAAIDLVEKGYFVHGIDISPKMIELCKQNFSQKGITTAKYLFSVGDLIDINFSSNSFDAVMALGFLEYQKDEHKALEIFKKIIRPGGILVCSGPAKIRISNFFGLGELLNRRYKLVSINRYSLSRFKILLESNGFTLIDHKQHGYASFIILNKLIGSRGEILLYRVLTKISSFMPIDRFANDIIVVGRSEKRENA